MSIHIHKIESTGHLQLKTTKKFPSSVTFEFVPNLSSFRAVLIELVIIPKFGTVILNTCTKFLLA